MEHFGSISPVVEEPQLIVGHVEKAQLAEAHQDGHDALGELIPREIEHMEAVQPREFVRLRQAQKAVVAGVEVAQSKACGE